MYIFKYISCSICGGFYKNILIINPVVISWPCISILLLKAESHKILIHNTAEISFTYHFYISKRYYCSTKIQAWASTVDKIRYETEKEMKNR